MGAEVHTCGARLTSPPEPWCESPSNHAGAGAWHAAGEGTRGACPDGGTCHHACPLTDAGRVPCNRVRMASPLTVAGWGDTWPAAIRAQHGVGRLQEVEAERLAEVCASCGREQHRTPGADCEDETWHDTEPAPQPEPALKGADLVAHLQRDRATLQDQVTYATQLLSALAARQEDSRLTVAPDELEAVDGMQLVTWRDEASGCMVYEVVQP